MHDDNNYLYKVLTAVIFRHAKFITYSELISEKILLGNLYQEKENFEFCWKIKIVNFCEDFEKLKRAIQPITLNSFSS